MLELPWQNMRNASERKIAILEWTYYINPENVPSEHVFWESQ